jgi:hypothetical protein
MKLKEYTKTASGKPCGGAPPCVSAKAGNSRIQDTSCRKSPVPRGMDNTPAGKTAAAIFQRMRHEFSHRKRDENKIEYATILNRIRIN